jgi:hypothetical protein
MEMKDCLRYLPDSVKTVSLRSDTSGDQEELPVYRGEGKYPRIGVIDFAIGGDVTEAFRAAELARAEIEWKPLVRMFDGKPQQTDREYTEVYYVPAWAGHAKNRADYRLLDQPDETPSRFHWVRCRVTGQPAGRPDNFMPRWWEHDSRRLHDATTGLAMRAEGRTGGGDDRSAILSGDHLQGPRIGTTSPPSAVCSGIMVKTY